MKQFLTVLKFEIGNYFKNKSFVYTTIILALIMAGVVIIPTFFMGNSDNKADPEDDSKTVVALLDEKGILGDLEEFERLIPEYDWVNCSDERELKDAVNNDKAEAGFMILGETQYTYVVENRSMMDSIQEAFEDGLARHYRENAFGAMGIDAESVEALYNTPIESDTMILGKDSAKNYMYTYVLVFVMYLMVIFYGQMIATSVTSEKSNRAIEILVTSVNSNSLIFGKVLAGAISSIIQGGVILGAGIVSYNAFRGAWNNQLDFLFDIPTDVWLTFILFGILGYLLYAFIFGMLGALVSKTEDISKSSTPITLIYVAAFIIAIVGMNSPDSVMMKVASFIPFTSCNCMFIRVAMGSVSAVEVVISALILMISCVFTGFLAAKVFRFGTLMYGNPIKFTNALKKIREK
ncbi:MAG TPA: ABC transporter permease [Candidatus Pelethocola excrementipullorum]|nr:ABC transporter permease [Candidatus Pelethocola excrementipullorum]